MIKKTLVYFGSPDFSAEVLKKIQAHSKILQVQVCLVVSQPDKPAGRGLRPRETPVKSAAKKLNIEVFDFHKDKKSELIEKIKGLKPDYAVLYAFNEIIPEEMLKLFPMGIWNIHPSLLPQFRGPSPVAFPLILGHKETGVTIMKMEKEMDTGPILAQSTRNIENDADHLSLIKQLSVDGFLLLENLLKSNQIVEKNQNHNEATYTLKIKKDDGFIPVEIIKGLIEGEKVTTSSIKIISEFRKKNSIEDTPGEYFGPVDFYNLARAFSPWPGIWTKVEIGGKIQRLKLFGIKCDENTGKLTIESAQLEGRNLVSFNQWNNSYKIFSVKKLVQE